MSGGRLRSAATYGLAAVLLAAPLAMAPARADDNPLDGARRAATTTPFSGQVMLEWRDAAGDHQQLVEVRSSQGVMVVDGAESVMARQYDRLVRRPGAGWVTLYPGDLGPLSAPAPAAKYELTTAPGLPVAGRATSVVDVRRGGVLTERLSIDTATGLVLERQQFDSSGALERALVFRSIEAGGSADAGGAAPTPAPAPPPPPATARAGDEVAIAAQTLPAVLPGSYERLAAYKRGALTHVVYSDGVYGLSVFEQRGRLRPSSLPSGGDRVAVGRARGWHYTWPGGHVVVWARGTRVYSAIGDGPAADVVTAAAALPAGPAPSLLDDLRQACRRLLRAF